MKSTNMPVSILPKTKSFKVLRVFIANYGVNNEKSEIHGLPGVLKKLTMEKNKKPKLTISVRQLLFIIDLYYSTLNNDIIHYQYKRPVGLSSFVNCPPVVALFLTQRQLSVIAGWQHMGRVPHPYYINPGYGLSLVDTLWNASSPGGGGGGGYSSSSRAGRLGRTMWPQNSTSVWKVCKKGGQKSTILKNIGVKILKVWKWGSKFYMLKNRGQNSTMLEKRGVNILHPTPKVEVKILHRLKKGGQKGRAYPLPKI